MLELQKSPNNSSINVSFYQNIFEHFGLRLERVNVSCSGHCMPSQEKNLLPIYEYNLYSDCSTHNMYNLGNTIHPKSSVPLNFTSQI